MTLHRKRPPGADDLAEVLRDRKGVYWVRANCFGVHCRVKDETVGLELARKGAASGLVARFNMPLLSFSLPEES